jgi:cell division protein FtsB
MSESEEILDDLDDGQLKPKTIANAVRWLLNLRVILGLVVGFFGSTSIHSLAPAADQSDLLQQINALNATITNFMAEQASIESAQNARLDALDTDNKTIESLARAKCLEHPSVSIQIELGCSKRLSGILQ